MEGYTVADKLDVAPFDTDGDCCMRQRASDVLRYKAGCLRERAAGLEALALAVDKVDGAAEAALWKMAVMIEA